jgi:integrase
MRMTVARQDCRYGHRDATAILVAFRREVRASELVDLQWDQIDFVQKTIRINRVKNGTGSTHYLGNSEWRALRRLHRENPPGPHVFVSERGGTVTTAWFRTMMARLGERAKMPFTLHPHMLRHSCGFLYAGRGYAVAARFPWPPQHPEHGALYGYGAGLPKSDFDFRDTLKCRVLSF